MVLPLVPALRLGYDRSSIASSLRLGPSRQHHQRLASQFSHTTLAKLRQIAFLKSQQNGRLKAVNDGAGAAAVDRQHQNDVHTSVYGGIMTFIKNWVVAFVSLFLLSFIWHNVILTDFYTTNLAGIGRFADGAVAPLLGFLALGIFMVALGFAKFVVDPKADSMTYAMKGLIMGLVSTSTFAVLAHALFTGWSTGLMIADFSYGLISSVITALILMPINKKA
jgi:uncharacterized membrane protein